MKNTILLLLSLLFVQTMFAQGKKSNHPKKEEIKAQKVAFISTELNLTKDEAEKFWPVYNAYEDKMQNLHKEHRVLVKKMKNFDELSEEEAYTTTEKLIKLDAKKSKLRKEYLVKFSEILGKKKGAKVFYAEEKFKRELLRKIKKNGGHKPPANGK